LSDIFSWDLVTLEKQAQLEGHVGEVQHMILINVPNQSLVCSAAFDQSILIWDAKDRVCLQELQGHQGSVASLLELEPGLVASCSGHAGDFVIHFWKHTSGISV